MRISSLRLLGGLLVAYLVFVAVVFPRLGSGLEASERGPLDLRFHYTVNEAHSLLEALGPGGRSRYALGALTVDVLYPVTYTLLFSVALTLLLGTQRRRNKAWGLLVALPPLVMAFDLVENASIVTMIALFPKKCSVIATIASLATSAKWTTAAVVISAVLFCGAATLWQRLAASRAQG